MEEYAEEKELILVEGRKHEGFKFYVEKTGKTMAERHRATLLR
jgi:hypothetical protein